MNSATSPVLVLGIGNFHRGDDAAGLEAAKLVQTLNPENAIVKTEDGDISSLIAAWENHDRVILVDATHSNKSVGTIQRFDASRETPPAEAFSISTHTFSVIEAIELARALNSLPSELIIYAIEGKDFERQQGLSPEVEDSLSLLAQKIVAEVANLQSEN